MNPSSTVDSSPVPARRRWRKRLLIALSLPVLFFLLIAAVLGYLSLANSWRWQAVFAEADRLDPGWRCEDLKAQQPALADEENAAAQVLEFMRIRPANLISGQLADSGPPAEANVQLSAPTLALAQTELALAGAAVAVARKLADLPRSQTGFAMDKSYFPTQHQFSQETRIITEVLKWDSRLRCQSSDFDGALASCRGILHGSRAATSEPLLVSYLVRFACNLVGVKALEQVCAQGEPSNEALAVLQRVLVAEEEESLLLNFARGERAPAVFDPEVLGSDHSSPPSRFLGTLLRPLANLVDRLYARWQFHVSDRDRREYFTFLTDVVELAKQRPIEEQERGFYEMMKKIEKEGAANPSAFPRGLGMMLPGLAAFASSSMRHRALMRSALLLVAAERYRRAKGQWPVSLEALTPEYLQRLPQDPYDGQTIRLKRVADGLIVYSVGIDLVDDGGKLAWPPQRTGADIGLKLWDVAQRRQPAKK